MKDLDLRGIEDIISEPELEKALKESKKLRLKLGVDPSSPDIHLGHAVVLRNLRKFQDQGHTVIFLIGDGTARIGDPSGRNKTRPVLTEKEIKANARTYLDQMSKILDIKKAEVRRNSEWLDKLNFTELLKLAGNFTVAQLIEREDFKKRLAAGSELSVHELLYPIMQAYDSVMLESDVEFGGTDQYFNLLAGRSLQKKLGMRPQQVITSKLLVGTDGMNKMSKSLGNYVGITDAPSDMYGKIMSIPDEIIIHYFELCTDYDLDQIKAIEESLANGANPRDVKASLAHEITQVYHGKKEADAAAKKFDQTFKEKKIPKDIPVLEVTDDRLELVWLLVASELAGSKTEARRLIEQGGVKIEGAVIGDVNATLNLGKETVIQVGKRKFLKVIRK